MRRRDAAERDLDAVRSAESDSAEDGALHRLGVVARSLTEEDHDLHDPPPGLWDRIAETVAGRTGRGDEPGTGRGTAGRDPGDAIAGPSRWLRSMPWLAAAAAVVVVAGIAAGILAIVGGEEGTALVASADLEPLGDVPAGSARLVETNGGLALDIEADAPALPDPAGFYEVWLIDEDIEGMISLGPIRPDGTYAVPDAVDYHDYPVVDVSVEPDDGDPAHSGSSILRGTLGS
ncbi:MAG TPA: anti-sigma factor [Acidimicrobiales bacterium]